jgi:hypothetical protein
MWGYIIARDAANNKIVNLCPSMVDPAVAVFEAALKLVATSEEVVHLLISGTMMPGVGKRLFYDAFVKTVKVTILCSDADVFEELCDALEDDDCMIETLELEYKGPLPRFEQVMAKNTSLRRINMIDREGVLVRCVAASQTVDDLELYTPGGISPDNWELIHKMPAVYKVTVDPYNGGASEARRLAWPDCTFVRHSYFRTSVLRSRTYIPPGLRRQLYAMRECLDDVLPNGVIEDIAAAAVAAFLNNTASRSTKWDDEHFSGQ